MSNNNYGKRADKYSVTNDGMFRKNGTPVLRSAPHGMVIEKDVDYYTMTCPECGTEGRYDEHSDVICDDPECAVVINDEPTVDHKDFSGNTHNGTTTMGSGVSDNIGGAPALAE